MDTIIETPANAIQLHSTNYSLQNDCEVELNASLKQFEQTSHCDLHGVNWNNVKKSGEMFLSSHFQFRVFLRWLYYSVIMMFFVMGIKMDV